MPDDPSTRAHQDREEQIEHYRCEFCGGEQVGPDPAFCHRPDCVQPHRANGLMRRVWPEE
jgi:hypothetical protein